MAKERQALGGKVVAITGGARGIGKATATALVRKGCRVAIGDIDLGLAEQTAAALGGGTIALPLDVTDRASFAAFLDEAERQLGPVDVVINNAGIMPVTPFVEESEESVRRQIDINLHGVITGTQLAIERMRPRGTGHIVNIASQAGKGGAARDRDLLGDQARGGRPQRGGARRAARQRRRDPLRDADGRQHRADQRRRPALGQTGRGRGRRRRDRRRARSAAASTSGCRKPTASIMTLGASGRAALREALGRLMKVDKLMTEVDHGARNAYEERVAQSEPGSRSGDGEPARSSASAAERDARLGVRLETRWAGSTTRPGGGASRPSTTVLESTEEEGLREMRRETALQGERADDRPGSRHGANLGLYPDSVTELVLAEPDPHMLRKLRPKPRRPGSTRRSSRRAPKTCPSRTPASTPPSSPSCSARCPTRPPPWPRRPAS